MPKAENGQILVYDVREAEASPTSFTVPSRFQVLTYTEKR